MKLVGRPTVEVPTRAARRMNQVINATWQQVAPVVNNMSQEYPAHLWERSAVVHALVAAILAGPSYAR
jgi:hypothetical protein